jgi:hypothetical protein
VPPVASRADTLLTMMRRAGHEESKTTLGKVREADAVGLGAGAPFPPLPASMRTATDSGHSRRPDAEAASKQRVSVASPTGFEPVLQP